VPPRTINVLHIEDDEIQRSRVGHHLAAMSEFRFAVTCVENEDAAVATFGRGGTDLVILDYQLSQGNGLSCLHKLRQRDSAVPIIAISGVATPEIAANLLQAGADEYIEKQRLDSEILARSVRHILARTAALQQGGFANDGRQIARLETLFRQACEIFVTRVPPEFFQQLDDLEATAREADVNIERLQMMFETVCSDLELFPATSPTAIKPRLRPVLLEILVRLFRNAPSR
jgi:DNA-binding response OmpR family regulator